MVRKTHLIALASMVGVSVTAFAGPQSCPRLPSLLKCSSPALRDSKIANATGYTAEIKLDQAVAVHAVLERLTVNKNRKTRYVRTLAEIPCKPSQVENPSPDHPQTMAVCEDPTVVDAGYVLEVLSPNFAGIQEVKVIQNSFAGPKVLGTLTCSLQ